MAACEAWNSDVAGVSGEGRRGRIMRHENNMCDVRLFRSAKMDYETAAMIWRNPYNDEMILNNAAEDDI